MKAPSMGAFFIQRYCIRRVVIYTHTHIHTTTRQVVDMAVEQRVHKFVKVKKSANDKVQAIADRDHGGNWHAALHRIIEEAKA